MIDKRQTVAAVLLLVNVVAAHADDVSRLERLSYNNPGLIVDLGVGLWAWPLPMDYDHDGDLDLVVCCPDVPHNGTYFFENPGDAGEKGKRNDMPVFNPAVRIAEGLENVQVSYIDGNPCILTPGIEYLGFSRGRYRDKLELSLPTEFQESKIRANQWKYVDYDGDGRTDLVIGIEDWADYGWDNAFDERGEWTHGPLHGRVYFARNTATNDHPQYAVPIRLTAEGHEIDTYGMPSPNFADFDNDGDLDLLCGEFVDKFTYFENVGSRREPRYRRGRILNCDGKPLQVALCMMVPVAVDWNLDGHTDLVVGQEDGRVMLIRHSGSVLDGLPQFESPQFFRQEAAEVKFGALAAPVGIDWDNDGDHDIVSGNTAGEIGFIENLGGCPPKWAAPQLLEADGQVIRIQAGKNGSIQGPCEAKWGYTTLSVADWNMDGLADLVVNSIWGKVVWYRNIGTRERPQLTASRPIEVEWLDKTPKPAWTWWNPEGKSLATEWRTTPVVVDFNDDELPDLVMLDQEGYLAFFERARRDGQLKLLSPRRVILDESGKPLRLASGAAGASGRRKLCLIDWNRDGLRDILVNADNVQVLTGAEWDGECFRVASSGLVDSRQLAGHDTSPTVVDWDKNGIPDLLIGAEDGCFYYLRNPHQ